MVPEVNRAFSAGAFGFSNPSAMRQADGECCAFGAEQIASWRRCLISIVREFRPCFFRRVVGTENS